MFKNFTLSIILSLLTASCASVVSGTHQSVTVFSKPETSQCHVSQGDNTVSYIPRTPYSVSVDRTKEDITVECQKPGYETTTVTNKSGVEPWTYGNAGLALFGVVPGLAGWGIDSALGSDNKYQKSTTVVLPPEGQK